MPNTSITPIANLLGRSGSHHLLLGLLIILPAGTLALADLTGSISLDLQHARPTPENGAYFAPGMMVLVEGAYEDEYSVVSMHGAGGADDDDDADESLSAPTTAGALGNTGGVGGTIGGKFVATSVAHPPCERRSATLGCADDGATASSAAPAFGWTDFLGLGSERATGSRMARLASRLLPATSPQTIAIAADVHLDEPTTLSALRTLLRAYTPPRASTPQAAETHPAWPLAIVLMGNFLSCATLAGALGGGSIEYKEHFDSLAAVLADFAPLLAHTTLIFVPGDHDAWPSAFSSGAAVPLPRKPVPALFTNRVRRVVADANRDVWGTAGRARGKEGQVVWTSNPARLTWFGIKGEMVLLRDNVAGRLHRTTVRFGMPDDDEDVQAMDVDGTDSPLPAISRHPPTGVAELDPDIQTARSITRTLLSQSHLSPFPLSVRPVHWDYGHTLGLYPLPSALVVADIEAPAFAVKYCGCTVMNPGSVDDSLGRGRREGRARWIEYDIGKGIGAVRTEE